MANNQQISNMNTSGKEGFKSEQSEVERKVETVDYRSSAGQGQEQKPVQVTHQPHRGNPDANTSGGVLTSAAASVVSTLQSAKEAISRK